MSDTGWAPPPPPPPALPPELLPAATPLADQPPAAPSRPRRGLRVAAGGGIAVVVAAAVAGGILAFRLLHGSGDTLLSLAPSDTEVYVNFNLDPSAGQKLAIDSVLSKFPGLSGGSRDSTINGWLDSSLRPDGLSHSDVRSWLGSQLSMVVLGSGSATPAPGAQPAIALLISSTNDGNATSMFAKFRGSPIGGALKWSTSTHDGVTVNSGQGDTGNSGVWAITNHAVIIGSTVAVVDELIDTAQGKHAGLESTANYSTVSSQLPADRVAFVYVDVATLVRGLSSSLGSLGLGGGQSPLQGLDAYRGFGEAMVVSSNGVTVDGTEDFDASRMSAAQRAMLAIPAHVNGALGYVPAHAYGFMAVGGLPEMLRSVTQSVGPGIGASVNRMLEQLGVTGSSGILGHLSGDAGLEVDNVPGQSTPAGAVLLATDSASAAEHFLQTLVTTACGSGACDPSQQTSESYHGVTISTVPLTSSSDLGFSPSWAVANGWMIIASSPEEAKAVIDARGSGGIASAPRYAAVAGQIGSSDNSRFYLDIHAVVAAVRAVLPPELATVFDRSVAQYLAPFQSLVVSSQNAGDHITTAAFLSIG